MRIALQRKTASRQQVSSVRSYSAPVGGWNARDALAAMKPHDAVALENWFPRPTYVEGRGGYTEHATGMTGNGKTLAAHNGLTGTNKLFCMTSAGVYDVSSAGAVGASVAARTNGKHQWVNFGDGTYNWLIALNGADAPLYYDGTTWTAVTGATSPALTGITTTDLIGVFVFKGRLIFLPKTGLSFWYLAAGVAGGALTEFDFSGDAPRGGYVMAASNWTMDGGDGIDDYAVFVTSEGEVLVYRGTNPSSAAQWAKVGTYYIGEPLGRRCMTKLGGDLLILTRAGLFPMSAALSTADSNARMAISFKIENAFNDAASAYGDNFGWETVVYPAESALLVNVPTAEDGTHEQYVMNTITKAWCKFTDWDAETFAVLNGELYFSSGTGTYKAWSGASDNGSNIVLYGKTAFSYFDSPGQNKHFRMFRPVMASNGSFSFLTDIDVDFEDGPIAGTATYSSTSGAVWDQSNWDDAYWAGGMDIVRQWTTPDAYMGYAAAGKLKVATNSLTLQWMSSDYMFERGGPL